MKYDFLSVGVVKSYLRILSPIYRPDFSIGFLPGGSGGILPAPMCPQPTRWWPRRVGTVPGDVSATKY